MTTLSDECQTDYMIWLPPSGGGDVTNLIPRPEIVSLRGPGQPSLDAFPTITLAPDVIILIVIDPDGSGRQQQSYQRRFGDADPLDGGQVKPLDWNSTTNNYYWSRVG